MFQGLVKVGGGGISMAEYRSCESCKYKNKRIDEYPCNHCIHNAEEKFVPQTNADRIRAMQDEDLADAIYAILETCSKDVVPFCKNKLQCTQTLENGKTIPDEMCKQCLIEWLQSESEV